MLGSCMYTSWHVDSREVDVAVTASNRQVMRWCGYGMLWRWLLLQLQALQNKIKPTKHKVVGNNPSSPLFSSLLPPSRMKSGRLRAGHLWSTVDAGSSYTIA